MNEVERMDAKRDRLITLSLASFLVWQGGDIAQQVCEQLGAPKDLRVAAVFVSLIGGIAWGYSMLLLRRFFRRLGANPSLAAALEDEGIRDARLRSCAVALVVTMGCVAITTGVGVFAPLSARLCGQFTILLGAGSVLVAFLYYRR